MNNLTAEQIKEEARAVKAKLDRYGLAAEFVAPRLWMDPHCVDGGFMSTSAQDREFAMWRAYRSIDIANELGASMIVLWLAREGTLCAESKSPVWATRQLIDAINKMLEYDSKIKVCIEPKPNEPIDRSVCATMGHVMAISAATIDPSRVGGNLESAHASSLLKVSRRLGGRGFCGFGEKSRYFSAIFEIASLGEMWYTKLINTRGVADVAVDYKPLWHIKMEKNPDVSTDVLRKIRAVLNCTFDDIVEINTDENKITK